MAPPATNKPLLFTCTRLPKVQRSLCIAMLAAGLFATGGPARGQNPPAPAQTPEVDLTAVYNEGVRAFSSGDFKTATDRFEMVLKLAPPEAQRQFEPLYFTLGAAWFNLGEHAKAVSTFQTYLKKYPNAARAPDVKYALAQSRFAEKDFAKAAEDFLKLSALPKFQDPSLLFAAQSYREAGENPKAIAVLERLIAPGIKSRYGADGALLLAVAYSTNKEPEKARRLLRLAEKNAGLVDNIAQMNALIIEAADQQLSDGAHKDAIDFYRMARQRDELIDFQKKRIAALEKQLDRTFSIMRGNPQAAVDQIPMVNELKGRIERAKTLLADYDKLPDFAPGLLIRTGQAFYGLDKKWESAIVFRELLENFPGVQERESAQYALLVSLADLGKAKEALAECDVYLKEFPSGPNANTVGFLRGATALEAGNYEEAANFFGLALEKQPNSEFRERMQFLLGNAKFSQGKYDEAVAAYAKYKADFPKGEDLEEAVYRGALALLFNGKFPEAISSLNAYLATYPQGNYVADAKYRLGVCDYAASQYEKAISACLAWEQEYPRDPGLGETLSLLGDAYAAQAETPKAIESYIRAQKAATTDEVLGYAQGEAAKLMQKSGDWQGISRMFEEFVKQQPDHPFVVTAAFWIGKARARLGEVEQAKALLADSIKTNIDNRERSAVEQLLTLLAEISARKKKKTATETEAALKPDTENFNTLLGVSETSTPLARARALFAEAEFLRFRKQQTERETILKKLQTEFPAESLSAPLLATVGDSLLGKDDATATVYFRELLDSFSKSEYADCAFAGLGDIAFRASRFSEALDYFQRGLNESTPITKLKELTIGKARAQLALGQYDEAEKGFAQVAGTREWKGEATALALYSQGEIELKRGDLPKAIAYFQRVYVAYARYPHWVAKAYLRSAECFRSLGKTQEAKNTYNEMLQNQKLQSTPELREAEQKLKELGQS